MERTQKKHFICLTAASLCFAAGIGSGSGAFFGMAVPALRWGLQALAAKEGHIC